MATFKNVDARSIEASPVTAEGARDVTIRWLIAAEDGAERFHMRLFEIAPGGRTPRHAHDWEHEVYVLEGTGTLLFEGAKHPIAPGRVVFVPGGSEHSFMNTGDAVLAFLCLVPAD
ncbi:MAG: cupin domain-containing protein [Candidatus Krumholzibacteriota bacterium]|nr:cupin domain-containing protein [Candidatus Krumholzibacteriota bacterium]